MNNNSKLDKQLNCSLSYKLIYNTATVQLYDDVITFYDHADLGVDDDRSSATFIGDDSTEDFQRFEEECTTVVAAGRDPGRIEGTASDAGGRGKRASNQGCEQYFKG